MFRHHSKHAYLEHDDWYKIHPINPLHILSQAKLIKTCNTKNKSNELAHLILVLALIAVSRNEGLGEPM